MKQLQKKNYELLSQGIRDFFSIREYKDILQFTLQDVDLSDDVSSEHNKVDLDNHKYMLEPLSKCFIDRGIRKEVVIAWPEQLGKSLVQMITLLHSISYNQLQSIVLYPSQELSEETALTKFVPLLKKLKTFETQLSLPFAVRKDRIKLSNALVYFQGAGSKVVSRSCKLVIADEASIYQTPNNVNNLNELKKRTRSYSQCLQLFISTPRYKEDVFWRQYLGGSQGYYYLRCLNCGQLTIRSCDIHNLQFQTQYNEQLKVYVPIRGSERLVCPKCKHEHLEADKKQMIDNGAYVHLFPDRVNEYPTYQASVLVSLLPVHSWYNIASIQLESGKTADLQDYINFDNSIRGLPYQQRQYKTADKISLQHHVYTELPVDKLSAVFITADTQETFSVVTVWAMDYNLNLYLLELARPRYLFLNDEDRNVVNMQNKQLNKKPETTVYDMLNTQYYGLRPLCLLVDLRGHRSQEVKEFAKLKKNILLYGGTSLKHDAWNISKNNPKLFLVDAKHYQSNLIFNLYYSKNTDSHYMFFNDKLTDEDWEQILSVQPDKTKRNGSLYENWTPNQKVHDCFDCAKMALALRDIVFKIYHKDKFKNNDKLKFKLKR